MESPEHIHPSGTLIAGRYEVVVGPREEKHLMGGMGLVYLCVDQREQQPVALKTFQPTYLSDRVVRDRFLQEGTMWCEFGHHPCLVQAYNVVYGGVGENLFLVLEYVAPAEGKTGASLREWLAPGQPKIAWARGLRWMWELAQGLAFATQMQPGFVHRDVKPENILIGRDGQARLTDLGLARCFRSERASQVESAQPTDSDMELKALYRTHLTRGRVGTPLYMAPEQWHGYPDLDERTDIYAWGCVLFELLTGQRPLPSKTKEGCEIGHISGQVGQAARCLPSGLRELVTRCVAIDANDRYGSWPDVLKELERGYSHWTQTALPTLPTSLVATKAQRVALGWSLTALGCSYLDIGKPKVALEYFQKAKTCGEAEHHRALQGVALSNLGRVYHERGDTRLAVTYHEQNLVIARKIGNRTMEGATLGYLGKIYHDVGDLERAIRYHEEHLTIARETGHRVSECAALGNLGRVYHERGDLERALRYFEQDLTLALEIGNRTVKCAALGNLGRAYLDLGELEWAITYHEQYLALAREIGNPEWELEALNTLGWAYHDLGDPKRAITYNEQGLALACEIGNQFEEAISHFYLSQGFRTIQQVEQARFHAKAALVGFSQVGDTFFTQKVKQLLDLLPDLRQIIRPSESNYSFPAEQAFTLHKTGQFSKVLEVLEKSEASMFSATKNEETETADLNSLLTFYSQSLMKNPNDAEIYILRGKVFLKMGLLQEAERDFTEVVEWEPMLPTAYFERGKFYEHRKAYQAALEDYAQAVALSSDTPEYQFALGAVYYRLGSMSQARKHLTKAKVQGHPIAPLLLTVIEKS